VTTLRYFLSNQPLEFLTIIHQVISDYYFFSVCLEMYPESSILLSKFIAYPTRHPICPIFASLEVMPRASTALHLPFAYNDSTRQLANCNDNYKFFAYPYSILQKFTIDSEVIVTSYHEIVRKHNRSTYMSL